MPGTSDQWKALDRQNERLVDAGSPLVPAGPAAVPGAEAHPAEADPDAGRPAGRHRTRGAAAAAASALAIAG
jgi:hypothetical protein